MPIGAREPLNVPTLLLPADGIPPPFTRYCTSSFLQQRRLAETEMVLVLTLEEKGGEKENDERHGSSVEKLN